MVLCKVNTPLIYTHTRSFICFSDWSKSEAEEIPTRLFPSTLPTLSLTLSSAKLKQQLSQNPIVFHASWAACIPHTVRTLSLSKKLCLYKSSALKESLDYILNMYFRGYALSSSPENESLLTHPCCFKPTWLFFSHWTQKDIFKVCEIQTEIRMDHFYDAFEALKHCNCIKKKNNQYIIQNFFLCSTEERNTGLEQHEG